MDDAALVRFFERLRDLFRDRDPLIHRDRTAAQTFFEIFAFDQFHCQVVAGGPVGQRRVFEAVDLRDVRMVQRGQQLRFALEARHALRIGSECRG